MTATPAADALEARFRRLSALSGAAGMLGWDQHVLMPSGGAEARAEQLATLSVLRHELLTAPEVADDLAAAAEEPLEGWRAANLVEMRRTHAHATALSSELVDALSRAGSRCEALWREARAKADFSIVRDAMAEQIRLIREEAAAKSEVLGTSPYEALLDGYEPGGSIAKIEALFAELEAELPPLLDAVLERQARLGDPAAPAGPFPVATQRALSRRVMETLGFDFAHGRLDETLHPFCGGVPDDVRVTTRYDETGFINGIMGVIHETGHALYERGLPADWRTQPVGEARGMVMHESQSLLMEMQACRSPAFLGLLSGWAREAFGADGPAWEPENLRRIYTKVARSFIRVEADEVTYPLHVILRTPPGTGAALGRSRGRRPAGGVERGHAVPDRRDPAGRRARLPAGHPLVRRGGRVLPDLYPGRHGRGPAVPGCGPGRTRHPRRDRPRRLHAAGRLAADKRARGGQLQRHRGDPAGGHRRQPQRCPVPGASEGAVSGGIDPPFDTRPPVAAQGEVVKEAGTPRSSQKPAP